MHWRVVFGVDIAVGIAAQQLCSNCRLIDGQQGEINADILNLRKSG